MDADQEAALRELSAATEALLRSDGWAKSITERGGWGFVEESERQLAEDEAARLARLKQAIECCRQLFQL